MKLNSITLTNFRQFEGEQAFDLTTDDVHPVVMLFGANGAGKTTFLNAFTWCLYGILSDDLEQKNRLVSDSAWARTDTGANISVAVEIHFEHEGLNYRLLRSMSLRKESDLQQTGAPQIQLWVTNADGSSEIVEGPQVKVSSILPEGFSRFFFFNGERIEKLVAGGAYAEAQKDIKMLLELEHVERALSHLKKVDTKVTNDLRKNDGGALSKIQEAIDTLNERETDKKEALVVAEGKLAALTEEREGVLAVLRQHAEAAPIQERRDQVVKELDLARDSLEAAQTRRVHLIATRGFLAFTDPLCDKTEAMAQGLYRRGALPAPLKREFVDQLLDEGTCICGTELAEQSPPWKQVQEWRHKAGLQEVETAWQQLRGQIKLIGDARNELRDGLRIVTLEIDDLNDRISELVAASSELNYKLRDSRHEEVASLESKRIDLDNRIAVRQQEIGGLKIDLQNISKDLDHQNRERSKAEVQDELAARALERSNLVTNVRKALAEILAIREADTRRRLDEKLKEIYSNITFKKSYVPTLSANFELSLYDEATKLPVGKSTGENQILSLSFVAAVSTLARESKDLQHAEGNNAPDAGVYPIVMDAAFGSLDVNYQTAVSRALAKLAPQLVVLVSKSQGLGNVLTELRPFLSHLGVIQSHATGSGVEPEDVEFNGTPYPYIRPSETAHSKLQEIEIR
ncbi:AAA family ATPase [Arthrobacter sp. S1_S22]|nr:AAA family ATPase [Arthrobacter sp. S1_S22]